MSGHNYDITYSNPHNVSYSSPPPTTPGMTDGATPSTHFSSPGVYDASSPYQIPNMDVHGNYTAEEEEVPYNPLPPMPSAETLAEWTSNYLTYCRFRPLDQQAQRSAVREHARSTSRRTATISLSGDGQTLTLPWNEQEILVATKPYIAARNPNGWDAATVLHTLVYPGGVGVGAEHDDLLSNLRYAILDAADAQVTLSFGNKLSLTYNDADWNTACKYNFIASSQVEDYAIDEAAKEYVEEQERQAEADAAAQASTGSSSKRRPRR